MKKKMTRFTAIVFAVLGMLLVSACGSGTGGSSSGASGPSPTPSPSAAPETGEEAKPELTPVKHATSWYAQPEQGGQFAALYKGFYEEAGLDVTIEPGGPSVNPVHLLASGDAQFGMGQSDVVISARDSGVPVVAVAGIFQKTPIGMIFHKGQDIKDFSDLNGRTVYVPPTSVYWPMMKEKYGLDDVQEMNYENTLIGFMNDERSVTHGYVTNSPDLLAKQGIEVDYLLVHDSGYQPYATTIYTTEKMIEEQPETVDAFVKATIKGWEYYLDHYEEVNPFIQEFNPDLSLEEMNATAKAMRDLILTLEAETNGIGYMTEERWATMRDFLFDTEVITVKEETSALFTTEFLPQP